MSEQAALQAAAGFDVWRSYDEPGGIRDELYDIAASNSDLVKLEVLGHTATGARDHRAARHGQLATARQLGPHSPDGPVLVAAARARVDQRRGQPPDAAPLRRPLPRRRRLGARAAAEHRAVVRRGRQPGRLPVHVRGRAAVAQEPARQRQQRDGHGRRRRRSQPQLRRALGLRRRGIVERARSTRPTVVRARPPSPRRRRCRA